MNMRHFHVICASATFLTQSAVMNKQEFYRFNFTFGFGIKQIQFLIWCYVKEFTHLLLSGKNVSVLLQL